MSSTQAVQKISAEESWQVFDAAAQRLLKMSGDDLIRRWDGGELTGNTAPELMRVLMLGRVAGKTPSKSGPGIRRPDSEGSHLFRRWASTG